MTRAVTLVYVVVAGAFALWFFGAGVETAFGATYTVDCATAPPPSPPGEITDDAIETRNQRIEDAQNCAALAERLETLVALTEAAADTAPGTAAQRVALSTADRNRLDLSWWGVWAVVGTAWALMLAPMFQRAFRWWRE
jgi:hypothetical protein